MLLSAKCMQKSINIPFKKKLMSRVIRLCFSVDDRMSRSFSSSHRIHGILSSKAVLNGLLGRMDGVFVSLVSQTPGKGCFHRILDSRLMLSSVVSCCDFGADDPLSLWVVDDTDSSACTGRRVMHHSLSSLDSENAIIPFFCVIRHMNPFFSHTLFARNSQSLPDLLHASFHQLRARRVQ